MADDLVFRLVKVRLDTINKDFEDFKKNIIYRGWDLDFTKGMLCAYCMERGLPWMVYKQSDHYEIGFYDKDANYTLVYPKGDEE